MSKTEKDLQYDNDLDLQPTVVAINDTEHGQHEPPTLRRHLKNRHVTFVGFGGGIGVGLFIGSGAALAKAGPLGILLAFILTGVVLWSVFPVAGSFPHFAGRFIDPAVGFALGWNYFYTFALTVAAELVAVALLAAYWSPLNPGVWITVALVPMVILNCLPVKWYGESEVITASIQILTFLGLLILGIVIDLGGGPDHDPIGFRYWKDPGPMNTFPGFEGNLGRFLAFFSAFINAVFSYGGTEAVILTAAECKNPTVQIPRAARRGVADLACGAITNQSDICGSFVIGLTVPYTNPRLLAGTGNATSSPFIIAVEKAGIKVIPSIFNAAIITSAWSAGNTYIYMSSRTLMGLSLAGQAPRFLLRTTKAGVPYYSVGITSSFGLLAYLSCGTGGSSLPIFIFPIIGWKFYKKTKFVKASEADIFTGRINEDDIVEMDPPPTTWWGKALDKIL